MSNPAASEGGAAATVGSDQHALMYKNRGLNSAALRRQREEEGLQLRKKKREEQVVETPSSFISLVPGVVKIIGHIRHR